MSFALCINALSSRVTPQFLGTIPNVVSYSSVKKIALKNKSKHLRTSYCDYYKTTPLLPCSRPPTHYLFHAYFKVHSY